MAFLTLLATSAIAQTPPPQPARQDYKATVTFELKDRRPGKIELFRGVVLFKATLGGRDSWVMLDNGADRSLIDAKLLEPLGIKSEGREGRTIRTPTGALSYRVALEVPFVIPGQLETRMPMAAVDLSAFSSAVGHPVDAVLGADLLNNLIFGFDPERGVLELWPASAKFNFPVQPIPLSAGKAQLEIMAEGKPIRVTIDLGFSGELSLSPEAWARVGPSDAKKEARILSHMDGKPFSVDHASLPVVTINGVDRKNVDVDIRPIPARDGDGWIGMGLISQFVVVMDMPGSKLWLIPRPSSTPAKPTSTEKPPVPPAPVSASQP